MAKNKDHHLEKRGDVWYFVAMVGGKRIKKALSTSVTQGGSGMNISGILISMEIFNVLSRRRKKSLLERVASQWVKIKSNKVKASTLRDYRGAMNFYILPRFGKVPIDEITYLDIEEFISGLKCSHKRINNILVPMRSMMKFALKAEIIDKNPMSLVENLKVTKPDIHPLSMDEVQRFLDAVNPYFRSFFVVRLFHWDAVRGDGCVEMEKRGLQAWCYQS